MKKLVFVVIGLAALSLAACGGSNQDVVDNAEMNQPAPDLNELSNEAAMDAANAEAAALGNDQQQDENVVEDNTLNPTDAQEQNVSGM
jgi:hypothetical protein